MVFNSGRAFAGANVQDRERLGQGSVGSDDEVEVEEDDWDQGVDTAYRCPR